MSLQHRSWADSLIQPIQCSGFILYTDPADTGVSQAIRQNKVWEAKATTLLRENLRTGQVFVDCGAHIGYYTCMAASILGSNGSVFAFEPSHSYYYLSLNILLNGFRNVTAFPFALWSKPALLNMLDVYEGNTGATRVGQDKLGPQCIAITLDSQFQPNTVDFIKIDVQGTDNEVIRGGAHLIGESPNIQLLVEDPDRDLLASLGLKEAHDVSEGQGPNHLFVKEVKS